MLSALNLILEATNLPHKAKETLDYNSILRMLLYIIKFPHSNELPQVVRLKTVRTTTKTYVMLSARCCKKDCHKQIQLAVQALGSHVQFPLEIYKISREQQEQCPHFNIEVYKVPAGLFLPEFYKFDLICKQCDNLRTKQSSAVYERQQFNSEDCLGMKSYVKCSKCFATAITCYGKTQLSDFEFYRVTKLEPPEGKEVCDCSQKPCQFRKCTNCEGTGGVVCTTCLGYCIDSFTTCTNDLCHCGFTKVCTVCNGARVTELRPTCILCRKTAAIL
jgi:hypothetical protein